MQARVKEAASRLFGTVQPQGNLRSGRKVLKRALKGPAVAQWYPYTLKEVNAPGYEDPIIEDFYREEQELNRVGKTRIEGKLKPIREEVIERIKFSDYNMDEVNWDTIDDRLSASTRGSSGSYRG
eukprot:TRINITY_DN96245_c0_g1_i1.p1 TRINITY_DN96245_c0_g1~~TRINITY_DN96245_c0_g1_i1.p1  ORF type:complete len:134 (+),score=17.76 TRINITY_DN96245_c0_g1_i1:28-402(+)